MTHWMLPAALGLNLSILVPLCFALLTRSAGMDQSFGPATDARLILTCVYIAIAVASAGLLAAHWAGAAWVAPATLSLFAVQITYKLLTAALVGLSSPVVVTNLVVVRCSLRQSRPCGAPSCAGWSNCPALPSSCGLAP